VIMQMAFFVYGCLKWSKTLWHLGQDCLTLRSELSLGHFGISAKVSRQFRCTKPVPKCQDLLYPGYEVFGYHPNPNLGAQPGNTLFGVC